MALAMAAAVREQAATEEVKEMRGRIGLRRTQPRVRQYRPPKRNAARAPLPSMLLRAREHAHIMKR